MASTRAPALAAALDAFFAWYYRTYPVNATFIGVHAHDHRLPDFSEHGAGDALAGLDALHARLRQLPSEPLTPGERLDRALADGFLDIQRWEFHSRHFHRGNPCLYTGEAIFAVLALLLRPFAPLSTRVAAAIERLNAIPTFLAQGRANVRQAPGAWIERASRECAAALAWLARGLDAFMREAGVQSPALRTAAGTAAAGLLQFQDHLSALAATATDDYACGGEALDLLLRRGHWLDMDAAAVLGLGREHLALAAARLSEGAAALGVPDWRQGLDLLAGIHPSVESYYGRFTQIWEEARAIAERHALVTWPDYPIRYVPQPRWVREAAPHFYFLPYRAPAAFDRVPVVDYLVPPVEPDMPAEERTRRLRATNESVIKLNHVIHHGGLGHHVQNWNAYYRAASRIGQIAAVDCAGRIAMFCGGTMAEGWACYATDLMEEIGFLTPLERLAQAHTRLRMAARAVADVQLHTGAWTLADTAAFYRDQGGMSSDAAQAEAVKNSMFPGAALMYLIGNDLIHRLRRDCQGRQSGFDLRRFHDRVLSFGSVPVALVAAEMRGGTGC